MYGDHVFETSLIARSAALRRNQSAISRILTGGGIDFALSATGRVALLDGLEVVRVASATSVGERFANARTSVEGKAPDEREAGARLRRKRAKARLTARACFTAQRTRAARRAASASKRSAAPTRVRSARATRRGTPSTATVLTGASPAAPAFARRAAARAAATRGASTVCADSRRASAVPADFVAVAAREGFATTA